MLLLSYHFSVFNLQFSSLLALGAAAIWAATHYTLGRKPYGYIGLGDLFVFIFFGLVSVLGSYFVMAHAIDLTLWLIAPAVGIGLLSVAVLNVNNIRDMETDRGIRMTTPLRLGARGAKWYQTMLVLIGYLLFCIGSTHTWCLVPAAPFFGWHLYIVWHAEGRRLDPALPLLVLTTFASSLLYVFACYAL